jgi:hypothetical protein
MKTGYWPADNSNCFNWLFRKITLALLIMESNGPGGRALGSSESDTCTDIH